MTLFFCQGIDRNALVVGAGGSNGRGGGRHALCCDCDACCGYSCEPDELAIAAARYPSGKPGRVQGAARVYLRSFNAPSLLALPGKGLEMLSAAELDALEKRSA